MSLALRTLATLLIQLAARACQLLHTIQQNAVHARDDFGRDSAQAAIDLVVMFHVVLDLDKARLVKTLARVEHSRTAEQLGALDLIAKLRACTLARRGIGGRSRWRW